MILKKNLKEYNLSNYKKEFKIFKNFSKGEIFGFVLLYACSFILNKNLPKEDLGEYSYYYNLMILLYPLFSLNVFDSYNRFLVKNEINEVLFVRTVKKISFIDVIVMFVVTYVLFSSIEIASISFIILYYERVNFFRAKLITNKYSFLKIFNALLTFLGILCLLFFEELNFTYTIGIYGSSFLITAILGFFIQKSINETNVSQNKQLIPLSKILKFTIPVMGTSMVIWLLNFSDQHFIKMFFLAEQLGEYAISYRALNIIRIITGFFLVYWPVLYFNEIEKGNYVKVFRIRIVFISIIGLITFFGVFFSKSIYLLIGADKYLNFTNYFEILIIAEFLRIVGGIFMTFRSFQLKTYYNLYIVSFVTFVNIFLNYYYLKDYGVVFAAYSTLIATGVYFILTYFFSFIPERNYISNDKKNNQ